ncbi:hypothetical protein PV04_04342 [Phialophora macrospora]|uniref:Uncharacterized protein n=1 Tax=Phialophora macrospora TaxID=1851006 RepID=A0A0D2CT87_9EURO|nr:hypothetical protein PV04_04342 [Phialophora macrospora]
MAAVSPCSNLRYLEADCIEEQYKVLQVLSDDFHYAANILKYKVDDIENRSLAVRKAAWKANATDLYRGRIPAKLEGEEKLRTKQILYVAEQVKVGLKTLIEIVCATPDAIQAGLGAHNDLLESDIENDSEPISIEKPDLSPPLEDQLAKELSHARHVFVDSSKFVPVNFREVSTPVQREVQTEKCKNEKSRLDKTVRFVDDGAMFQCQEATKALYRMVQPSAGQVGPQGSKDKLSSHVEIPGRLAAKKQKEEVERVQSPARTCSMEQMEKELLAWVPNEINVPCLPVDRNLRGLMMPDAKTSLRDWTY